MSNSKNNKRKRNKKRMPLGLPLLEFLTEEEKRKLKQIR